MKKNELKINIESFINESIADYHDGDIVVMDNLKNIPPTNDLCHMEMLLVVYCIKGYANCRINESTYRLEEGYILLCLPNTFITNVNTSDDIELKILGLSNDVLYHSLDMSKDFWNIILYASKNPLISINGDRRILLDKFYSLLQFKLSHTHGLFHKEIMHSLFQCAFYELADLLASYNDNKRFSGVIRQGDLLFKRYIELLTENGGIERSVKAYAEKLCITPKYLSALCKKISGKTALSWIHQFTINAIIKRLKYSNMTIKEISDSMNFPNISFFGKFVKSQTGMSPSEYRKRMCSTDRIKEHDETVPIKEQKNKQRKKDNSAPP